MAITYTNTNLRNAMVAVIGDALNDGSIEIVTNTDVVLVELPFAADAFGDPTNGIIAANTIADADVVASGTISKANFRDSAGALLFEASAGVGGDVSFNKATLTQGDVVRVSSMTYAAPS